MTGDATRRRPIRIGTAGWPIPAPLRGTFDGAGSLLARYGRLLNAVEINSSFYRPHRRSTYERWATEVPEQFSFSVKLPKEITHQRRLQDCDELIARFASETGGLGGKLGAVLVQLPPSLPFAHAAAKPLFKTLAARLSAPIVCEPRHPSWFGQEAEALLLEQGVGRVGADPPRAETGDEPGGAPETVYLRLHGSPQVYVSDYGEQALMTIDARLRRHARGARDLWCIFDNTAAGAATSNALALSAMRDRQPFAPTGCEDVSEP